MINKYRHLSLMTLFLTEMYERYGFYVIQALLIFYLVQKQHLPDSLSYSILGAYTAFAYINSIVGGLIADKLLGYDRTIILGAILLIAGYYICFQNLDNFKYFALGLSIVATGTGNLKPNISSIISVLYKSPKEKESAYNIFYIGLYIGALSGSLLGGYLLTISGWKSTFFSAVIAMSIGLLCFMIGRNRYNVKDDRKIKITLKNIYLVTLAQISVITISFFNIIDPKLSNYIFMVTVIIAASYMIFLIISAKNEYKKSFIKFFYLTIFASIYWAIYFQQFFSISIASTRIFHGNLPNTVLTCFESLGIIIFGPIVTYLWNKLDHKNPSIIKKFSFSFIANSIVFITLAIAIHFGNSFPLLLHQNTIIITYLIIAVGELCISPVGLFMVSELVPKEKVGLMMGFYMLSIGIGGKMAGYLAQISNITNINDMALMQHTYSVSFFTYAAISAMMFIIIRLFAHYKI